MAALPVNSTARYFVDYQANSRPHTVSFRYDDGGVPGAPDVAFKAGLTVLLNACAAWMPTDLAYIEARYVPSGQTVSIPDGLPLLLTAGLQVPVRGEAPAFLGLAGRTPGGRQARVFLLGAGFSAAEQVEVAEDYRVTASENLIAAAIVTAADQTAIVGIDGTLPLWKGYVNLGYNSYWQRAVRG